MLVPSMLNPTSAAPKFAVADVTVKEPEVVTPLATDRARALSSLKDVPAGIDAVVAWFSVTRHAPLIDVTNVRGAIPLVPVVWAIGRFTQAVMTVQLVAVNVVAPDAMMAVFVIVRAAPLWYRATSKS